MKPISLTPERLDDLISRFPESRIAVLGDFFLDKYLDVDPALVETSVETGKPAHQVVGIRCSAGAAGTVVSNLAALGAGEIHAIGFTGEDGEGYELRKALNGLTCSIDHLHVAADRHTPTYLKPRDKTGPGLDAEHSRYDTKNRTPTEQKIERKIVASLDALLPQIDALVILDQVEQADCGVVTTTVRKAVCDRANSFRKVLFWVDSRRRICEFRNVIIKANQFEAMGIENPLPGDFVDLAESKSVAEILRKQNAAPVVVTRSADGTLVSDPDWTLVPTVRVDDPIDPTGAGDSVTAGAVLALCAGAALPEAALVGNLVASITIQQIGTTGTARPEELPPRLMCWRQQQANR